jgi:large subunit ribosomal protein L54
MLTKMTRIARLQRMCIRSYASPSKGKGGAHAAIVDEVVDLTRFVPTNIYKEGSHPELKPESDYPEWLFTLLDVKPTLGELERQGFDNLDIDDQRRLLSLANRKFIKSNNAAKSKK